MNRPLTYVRGYNTRRKSAASIPGDVAPRVSKGTINPNFRPCQAVSQTRCDLC
jgi:hypothetical protein